MTIFSFDVLPRQLLHRFGITLRYLLLFLRRVNVYQQFQTDSVRFCASYQEHPHKQKCLRVPSVSFYFQPLLSGGLVSIQAFLLKRRKKCPPSLICFLREFYLFLLGIEGRMIVQRTSLTPDTNMNKRNTYAGIFNYLYPVPIKTDINGVSLSHK